MAKKNRNRRKARSKSGPRSVRRGRRSPLAESFVVERVALLRTLLDPTASPESAAAALLGFYNGILPQPALAESIEDGAPGRADAVARAAMVLRPNDPAALAFAAQVASLAGDHERAFELLGRAEHAVRAAPLRSQDVTFDEDEDNGIAPTDLRPTQAALLLAAGRAEAALAILEDLTRQDPEHDMAQQLYGRALRAAFEAGIGQGAIERFRDRSVFDELREALAAYSVRPEFQEMRFRAWDEWFGEELAPGARGGSAERDAAWWDAAQPKVQAMAEWSWLILPAEDADAPEDEGAAFGEGTERDDTVLVRFSDDPATPPHLAALAREWAESVRHGLWQVADPTERPGLTLTDILTGQRLYVEVPEAQREGMARWTLLLGPVVPVDGVWRTGGAMIPVAPFEADPVIEEIFATARTLRKHFPPQVRPASVELRPEGVLARVPAAVLGDRPPPRSPVAGFMIDRSAASLLPALTDLIDRGRRVPMQVANTDGEPLLLTDLRIRVNDPDAVRAVLRKSPDFEEGVDGSVLWLGREMSKSEADMAVAEFKAQARREGWQIPPEELERPGRRYARAHLEFDGAVIRTHVNSRERRQGLLRILTEAGGEPEVIEESRIDPALDLPTPGEAAAPRGPADEGMSEEATLAWAQTWMDEKVPALAGLTPRQAVGSERHRPLLEALLREFEYRADQRRRSEGGSPDVDWLREELGMPARDVSPFG